MQRIYNDLYNTNCERINQIQVFEELLINMDKEENNFDKILSSRNQSSVQSHTRGGSMVDPNQTQKSFMKSLFPSYFSVSSKPNPDLLEEKVRELEEELDKVKNLLDEEDEQQSVLEKKLKEVHNDKVSTILWLYLWQVYWNSLDGDLKESRLAEENAVTCWQAL